MATRLGVLVAGGRGVRLGGASAKALTRLGRTTLLERALAVLAAVCDEVVVAAPAALELPVPPGMRVADAPGAAGPLAGVVAGLAARPYERAIVLGVDFPLVRAGALAALCAGLADRAALVPAPGGVPQPLVAVYAPRAAASLARSLERGATALTAAVLALEARLLADDELARLEGGLENFFNLNTPEDLAEAGRRLAAAGSVPA